MKWPIPEPILASEVGYFCSDISDELVPLSYLKPRLNMCIFELWQRERGEYSENNLHILPKLTDRLTSRWTALSRLHIGHSDVTQLFLLKGQAPLFCLQSKL